MSLATAALRALVQANVEIGLSLKGNEIQISGYQRQRVEPRHWVVRGAQGTTEVSFGPLDERLEYDAGILFVNGVAERTMPNEANEAARIPPRAKFIYQVIVTAKDD